MTEKKLLKKYPEVDGWEHLYCTLTSPMTTKEVTVLVSLIIHGCSSIPVEMAYQSQKGKKLLIVCKKV